MFQREILGFEEARTAVDAVLAEADKVPNRPVAVAVVDPNGDLICCARMDECYPHIIHMAIHKAYTAARMIRDTKILNERQRECQWGTYDWADSGFSAVEGGCCFVKPGPEFIPPGKMTGKVVGAIGVSGADSAGDERLAQVGVKALKL